MGTQTKQYVSAFQPKNDKIASKICNKSNKGIVYYLKFHYKSSFNMECFYVREVLMKFISLPVAEEQAQK